MDEMERARREIEGIQATLDEYPELRPPPAGDTAPPPIQIIRLPYKPTDISGSGNEVFSRQLGEQLMKCLDLSPEHGTEECEARSVAALGAMREIGPRDGLEGMLAAQMAATQSAGMEFLSRAVRSRRPQQGNRDGRLSGQLMMLFLRQTEMLQRLRGRERRSVRVEHERVDETGRTSVSAEREEVR
jgi:hypothetical protein